MIPIEDGNAKLAKVDAGSISKPHSALSVGQLEFELLKRFPRADAEPWDRTGILVGDPAALVSGIAVALDPTADAIKAARQANANVVLTHHPAFLDAPTAFSPSRSIADTAGMNVYKAISSGIALMNFHTALDVSAKATHVLPGMLSLDYERLLVPLESDDTKGYGPLCRVRESDSPFTLERMAARCVSVFGRMPRVWGNPSNRIESVVVANGSASNVVKPCLDAAVDCLVCGEIRYHAALDAAQAGLTIVELGHDVSELPLCALLAQAAVEAGADSANVFVCDQSLNWTSPDSTRI